MQDLQCKNCGGCPLRGLESNEYRNQKKDYLKSVISSLKTDNIVFDEPVFINDGLRRRAELDFSYEKKSLKIGFYEKKTHNIIDISDCLMLEQSLNAVIAKLRVFLEEFCLIPIQTKIKKKIKEEYIKKGTIRLLKADNGIDIILILSQTPNVNHRMLSADFVNQNDDVIRIAWEVNKTVSEVVVEKMSPKLYISDVEVDVPLGAFLQASKDAENKMIEKVMEYMGDTTGNIADLFCGLGTFTYPLSKNKANNVLSIDSSEVSLSGLKKALAKNQIHNVKVINQNLFKYPLEEDELKSLKAIVIDPPRAGAHSQCLSIASLPDNKKPQKIVFVSCNPQTFVNDAKTLIEANYTLEKITLVDQFVYSKHLELIALFTLTA